MYLAGRTPSVLLKRKDIVFLLLLTGGAVLVHGYHPGIEDAEIYLPAIKKLLHPGLYPFGMEFFQWHSQMSLFDASMAGFVRLSHLPLELVLFMGHTASIFLFLLACWRLNQRCFRGSRACVFGAALMAALLTLPVAGTAVYVLDQYFGPRSVSSFSILFAILDLVDKRYIRAGFWLVFTAAIHPLIGAFGLFLALLLWVLETSPRSIFLGALPLLFGLALKPPSEAYRRMLLAVPYFFLSQWQWFEVLGILAPLPLLLWFSHIGRKKELPVLDLLSRALAVFGLFFISVELTLTSSDSLLGLVHYQPLRSFHLIYLFLVLFSGGLLGEFALKDRVWPWLVVFVSLCGGMWHVQRALFPASQHIEWPGAAPSNDWQRAFHWVRMNTPQDAIFALNPNYIELPGEDQHGFRALAERSRLADARKDAGASTWNPNRPLAEHCLEQVEAVDGWKDFKAADFARLHRQFGVTWVVLEQPAPAAASLECPFTNAAVRVCRVPGPRPIALSLR